MSGKEKSLDVAIYLRKSRADVDAEREAAGRGESYDTLSKHRNELLSLAKREDFNILDIFEEVVSGEYIAERPEIQKLLENVKSMMYDAILVMDVDRFGRGDKMDQGRIERALISTGTLVITPTEILDPTSESGQFTMDAKSFISRMEYRQIKKRLQGGRSRAAKSGKDIGRKPPFGYSKGKDKILQVNEEEAKIVRLIFQWCIDGDGRMKIAERLTEMGIPSPTGKAIWSHVTVRKILENPKYKGDQVFRRVKWDKQEDGSYRTKKIKDPALYTSKEDAHEAIIDKETWDKAQDAIAKRVTAPVKQGLDLINPFAGILRCKVCGKAIIANNPSDRPQKYLFCDTRQKCGQKIVPLSAVETVVLEQLEHILQQLKSIEDQQTKQKAEVDLADFYQKRLKKIQAEIDKVTKRKRKVQESYEDEIYTKEEFLQRNREIAEELAKLEADMKVAQQQYESELRRSNQVVQIIPNIELALDTYRQAGSIADQNRLLKTIIKEIRYYRPKDWKGRNQFELEIELHE